MDLNDKHPAELDIHNMIKEVKSLLRKCKNQYIDEDLEMELRKMKDRIFDPQKERLSNYINDRGKVENMPKNEEELQRER
jgi:hypothetical protein